MLQEDEKYKALRDNLRSLPRIKAKNDFEARLMQRINTAQSPVAHVIETVRKDTAKKSCLSYCSDLPLCPLWA